MPKKKKGLGDYLPPNWGDMTEDEKDAWLSYPDDRDRKRKKKKSFSKGFVTFDGMKPKGWENRRW